MAIKGAKPDHGRVTPHLIVRNAGQAIDFYKRAFGAVELYREPMPYGGNLHAHLQIASSVVLLTEETPDPEQQIKATGGIASPQTLNGTTIILMLYVDDVRVAFQRALKAGASSALDISESFWGDEYGWIRDPYGYVWALASVKEELTSDEVRRRMNETFAKNPTALDLPKE